MQLFCAKYVSLFINLFKQRIVVTPHTRSKGTKGEQLAIKFLKKMVTKYFNEIIGAGMER